MAHMGKLAYFQNSGPVQLPSRSTSVADPSQFETQVEGMGDEDDGSEGSCHEALDMHLIGTSVLAGCL